MIRIFKGFSITVKVLCASSLYHFKITNGKDAVFTFTDLNNKTFNVNISPEI